MRSRVCEIIVRILDAVDALKLQMFGTRRQRWEAGWIGNRQPVASHRRLVLALAALVGFALIADAVDFPLRWRWSNPTPHGGNVVDMAFSPSLSLAVQVAERGQVFTSSDFDLWLPRDTGLTNSLRAVTFFGQRIVVTGENGAVLYADDVDNFLSGTLLDGPTDNWLEGVAASATLLVAAGDNGAIYTSANGVTWKLQNSGTSTWFRGAAAGGGNFVVVGEDGVILTSLNGTNWTKQASDTSQHLNRVGFAAGRFTAVGEGGVTLSSTNGGATWFSETTGATNVLQYAVTGGLDRLVDGVSEVRVQDAGLWSNELAKTNGPPTWSYYSAIGLPGFFLIAGQSGMQSEGYQPTNAPYFWLTPYDSVRNWLWDVTRLPSLYVAAGDYGTIMTSGGGVDWTLELTPPSVTNTTLLGIGGNTNLLLAVGDTGTMLYSPNLLTNIVVTNQSGTFTQSVSTLGVLWYSVPNRPTTNDLQGVGVLSNSLYVVTGARGSVFTSADGTNWTARASGTTNLLSSVIDWPSGLVASGDNGTLLTSSNGIVWMKRATGTTNWLYRVRWLNQTLLAVGQNGTILTSTNGSNWTARTSGMANWLTDAAFIEDTWFAVGLGGTVLTSSNLVNWTSRGTITKKPLYAAATDSNQLVIVGVEGVILRSQVVPDTTPISILGYSRVATNAPGPAYNVFLFGGKPDQRFTLDRATNLVATPWTTGQQLEIFDGSGTLYYLETLTGTNFPPLEFYRATLTP